MDYLWVRVGLKNRLGSTHIVEQLLFSIVPSVLTFDIDLILRSFFYCLGL